MTTEQKYQAVAQAIRQALPRMMEVGEGCVLIHPSYKFKYIISFIKGDIIYCRHQTSGEPKLFNKDEPNVLEVIGKEPMLNDVLEWLRGIKREVRFYVLERAFFEVLNSDFSYSISHWDLSKPYLKDQSEELINFLYELIK